MHVTDDSKPPEESDEAPVEEPGAETEDDPATSMQEAGDELASPEDEPESADSVDGAATEAADPPAASTPKKPRFGALTSAWTFLKTAYGGADPRSLGLLRIAMAWLLFVDVARRYGDLGALYSNGGWLTNHFSLYRPMSSHLFSLYHAFSSVGEVKALFFFHCAVNIMLLIGWRTKLMQFLAFILITSMNSRSIILENGGWVVLNLLVLWTLFLPMGARFSVDSVLKSLRERRERSLPELQQRGVISRPTQMVFSLAVLALLLQWAVIYYFNTVHKTGPAWKDGTALYYFLQQTRILTPLGVWAGDNMPLWLIKGLTHATLYIEGGIVVLLLTPAMRGTLRMVAWVGAIGLHFGIALAATLGPFSWVMMCMFIGLIPAGIWEWLAERATPRRPRRVVLLDEDSPVAITIARVIKRLDALNRIEFATADANMPARFTVTTAPDAKHAQVWTGGQAVRRIIDALPLGGWLNLPLGLSGITTLIGALLNRLVSRQHHYARQLALPNNEPDDVPSDARRFFSRLAFFAGQVLVVLLMVATGSQVLVENRAVPAQLKPKKRPEWMVATVTYPRLFQGWSMFAPGPPREDGRVVVDGRTRDGRKLDPLTGKEPDFRGKLPRGPQLGPLWSGFHTRVQQDRYRGYYNGFRDLLKNHHRLTGRPQDQVTKFDVWYISRQVPPPGQPERDPTYRKLFSHGLVRDSGCPTSKRPAKPAARGEAARPRPAPKVRPGRSVLVPPRASASARAPFVVPMKRQ